MDDKTIENMLVIESKSAAIVMRNIAMAQALAKELQLKEDKVEVIQFLLEQMYQVDSIRKDALVGKSSCGTACECVGEGPKIVED